ncbi:hypothetical protein UFOVP480_16 [uncultured Caudovirales phage]|uniref:Tape measure protein n=1 Tax=uncultured Caudovirales phage TaxID=2100421 RepID=A0A6J5MH89_9CAUD|nr:hypothetical protein UFOVP480_16 [uncultured Caudovirales phage]CAB4189657.1 hypothetical protein UFOVP1206_10 [uncultured Caudovirales phage]
MAESANVNINLNSKADLKGFKQAETASQKLAKTAKKLGIALGLAYSAKAIVSYSKAAMLAASQDQKAQKILTNNLKNVGLAYAAVDAESFIQSMEKQTAILDDNLRPAYSQLAQVTGSVTKTQDLMKLAFDVSSGSGLDYASTVDILSQAYVGNTKGLKQLNLGLTQAELKAMSFDEIQTKLRQNFAGAGGIALDTYAGSMARLSVATNNASETIGTALLNAVIKVSGSKGIDGLISKVDTLAGSLASVITQIGNMVGALNGTEAQKAFSPGFMVSGGRAGSFRTAPTGAGNMAMSTQSQDLQKSALAAQKKAELDAIKRNKELAKLAKAQATSAALTAKAKKDQAALDKAALALARGADVFDMDKIQINAALMANQEALNKLGGAGTEQQRLGLANDLVRLTIKQDMLALEDAIAAKDVAGATALAAKLNKDLAILGVLQGQNIKLLQINAILEAFEPKDLINLANLNEALRLLMAMAGVKISPITGVSGGGAVVPSKLGGAGDLTGNYIKPLDKSTLLAGSIDALLEYADAATARANAIADALDYQLKLDMAAYNASDLSQYGGQLGMQNGTVVNISAGVIASPDEFARMVQKAVQNANRFGNNLDYAGGL